MEKEYSKDSFDIFWGTPDSWVQERFMVSPEWLFCELKLLLLLFDNIIISPAFLLESSVLHQIFVNNRILLDSKIVQVSFSNMHHGLKEYSEIKQSETIKKYLYGNRLIKDHLPDYTSKKIKNNIDLLDNNFQKRKRRIDLPQLITNSIINEFDIDIPNKNNRSGFKFLLDVLISKSDYYTKYHLYEAISIWEPSKYDALYAIDKSTLSFLISSAIATDSYAAILFPNTALPFSYQEFGLVGNVPFISKIFSNIIGLNRLKLEKLTIDDIFNIRKTKEWILFRNSYFNSSLNT